MHPNSRPLFFLFLHESLRLSCTASRQGLSASSEVQFSNANVKVHHRKFKFIQNSATFEAIEVINHRILSIDHLSRDTLKVAQLIYLWYTIYFQSNQNRKCRFQGRVAAEAPQCNEDLFPGGAVVSNSRNGASVRFQLVQPRRWQGMGRDV